MKRPLTKKEKSTAFDIISHLPLELVVQLLETTHLSIADVFIYCRTNRWSYQLCTDLDIWHRIYNVRFGNIDVRRQADAICQNDPDGVVFRLDEFGFAASIMFKPKLAIGNMIMPPEYMEDFEMLHNEVIDVINQICGPPDDDLPGGNIVWSRDLGVLRQLFQRMIVYTLIRRGYQFDVPVRVIDCHVCSVPATSKCNHCAIPFCGPECFDNHYC